jgi:hypothetical protein
MATNRTTGVGLEVLNSGENSNARATGVAVETLNSGANSNAHVSGMAVEVLSSIETVATTTQSYSNLGGSGARRSVFQVTSTLPRASGSSSRSLTLLLNGVLSSTGKPYMTTGTAASGKTLEFDLLGLPRIITGYKWYQSAPVSPIEFAFEGYDGASWVTLSTDTISGAGNSTPFTVSFSNSTEYQKYRFREVSGTWNDSNIWQVEFEISGRADECGDRSSTITATTTFTGAAGTAISNYVDGAYDLTSSDSWWPSTSETVAGKEFRFQFATPRCIKYARIEAEQFTVSDDGTWKWQCSDDGSTWTDIGSSFTWIVRASASDSPTPVHDLSSNTTEHSYYRMLGVSGNISTSPYYQEALFDIADPSAGDVDITADFVDDAVLSVMLTIDTDIRLSASFIDEASLSVDATVAAPIHIATAFSDNSEFMVDVLVAPPINIVAAFSDNAKFTVDVLVAPLVNIGDVHISDNVASLSARLTVTYHYEANFADGDNQFRVKPLKVTAPTNLAIDFTDNAKFSAAIFSGVAAGSGPFYFAWVSEEDNQFNSSFLREDEDIFSFTLSQNEGDFAQLSVVIKNPRVGLLAPTRNVWAWLTFYDGTVIRPLFFGRLIGIPSNVFDTKITLDFVARPSNFAEQKDILAASMRDLPYFDPIFISPDSWYDPDVVLEARTQLWHIDRVTHELTVSDVMSPEDGVIELTEDDHLYDGLSTSIASVPLRRVQVVGQIPWTQTASGSVDLTNRVQSAWPQLDSAATRLFGSQFVSSYTFEGLSGDWPKPGAKFGQGWTVSAGSLVDQSALSVPMTSIPESFSNKLGFPISGAPKVVVGTLVYIFDWSIGNAGVTGATITYVPIGWGVPELAVTYDSSRNYSETVTIDLEADMQAIMTLPGDDEVLLVNLNANSVSDVTMDGSVPLGDSRLSEYISTPRGLQSLQYMALLGRANLVNRSRAVKIECTMSSFTKAFDVTLRKALLIHDHRLPGGQALGKITEYSLSYVNGKPTARVTINSAVGYGGALTVSDGLDAYIDDDYIDDYYVREGNIIALPSSDVTFTVPNYEADDDGIDFIRGLNDENVLRSITVTGGPRVQQAALDDFASKSPDLDSFGVVLQNLPTQVHVDILPIGKGPYITDVPVTVSKLIIPKQIDLEASS